MKRFTLLASLVFAMAGQINAEEISYFDFNSDDANGATGTFSSRPGGSEGLSADTGSGISQVVGAAYRFQSSANDDPRLYEQSAVRITTFPGTAVSNKTAGVEFRFSTVGYEGITGTYQGYYSSAVNRYWRVQYTADGTTWIDHQVIAPTTAQAWAYYNFDFSGVSAADNNPNFGFRIVAEWQSTATGSGIPGYVGMTQSYNVGAQFWVDIMKINGNPIDASNSRPTVSTIATQETTTSVPTGAIPFTIGDQEDSANNLTVEWSTVGVDLIDNAVLGGSGANRTIAITPKAGAVGSATITLKVSDTAGKNIITTFPLNIRTSVPANAVAMWDFNSDETDYDSATGTFQARVGDGTADVINTSYTFANSSTGLDPWTTDNSIVRMSGFPAAGTGNKTAGMEFRFSTVGSENLTMQWDHNNSGTGSRYYRAQYTADGVNWFDHVVVTNPVSGWPVYSLDFKGIRAADNNPNFGVRLVTEFESTATGTGADNYAASQSASYSSGGTWWVDRVTFSGQPVDTANLAPSISASTSVTGRVGAASIEIPFTVSDAETAAANLSVNWSTQTPAPIASATISGSGANRTLSVVPSGVVGTAELVLVVTDGGGKYSEARVVLTLLPDNTAPVISGLSNVEMFANSTSNVVATIGDLEQNLNSLAVTVESSSPWLLDSNNMVITGTGSERTLAITPVANAAGAAWVTVTVSDGTLSSSTSFALKVHQHDTIALWNFNSVEPDAAPATGSILPVIGDGTVSSIGSSTNSLGSLSAISFDPEIADNTKWRLGGFAAKGTSNKLNGAEFRFSTVGYENIAASWDHYNSATGSKYWRVQYTLDGTTFIDYLVYTNPVVTTFRPTGASFSDIPGANNNPNFGIRIVSEFESTATGAGLDEYLAVSGGTYGTGGTLWLDMVRFTGESTGSVGPALQIVRNGNQLEISWPENAGGTLESTATLGTQNWQPVSATPEIVNGKKTVVLPLGAQSEFFRLGGN